MVKPLLDGFKIFRKDFFAKDKDFFNRLIKRGQKPKIMVISCSDSRVDPAILFGTRPGELFVVRNVANLVPPYAPDDGYHGVSAAIEFAVRDLLVDHIIVLGHAYCGGICALCDDYKLEITQNNKSDKNVTREFINSWINISRPAIMKVDFSNWSELSRSQAEQLSIVNSLTNLMTFPWVLEAMNKKKLLIHGWWFDMENAELWSNDKGKESFSKLML
ncbi:MAG: carbonic anhydrase [Alphaproteobacteria bacterium]|nr:carbonic anhydrase [Alphaproteobacteria bacterium]